jgi:non-specific protein-tyrosine kinase
MDNELEERSSLESIIEYAQLLLHWAWLLILAALIAGGVAYFLTNRQQRVYQSDTLVMVNGASGYQYDSSSSIYLGMQLASTYSLTMTTQPVLDAVAEKLGYPVSGGISVQQVENTQLIRVTVTDTDPYRAAEIANALVAVFADQILSDQTSRYTELKANMEAELAGIDAQIASINAKLIPLEATPVPGTEYSSNDLVTRTQLETSLSQLQQSRSYLMSDYQQLKFSEASALSTIIQKDPAIPHLSPIQPRPLRSGALAAVVGFMIAAGIIFLIYFLEDTIRDPEEITRKWGVPVIGLITTYSTKDNPIITMSQPRSPVAESFRSIRTNLEFSGVDKPLNTIVVTSPSPEDGKSSVAANLANVLSQSSHEVVVIDADLRKPRLHKLFQISNRIGFSDYFIRTQDRLSGMVKKTDSPDLCVITSGSIPPNPSELLSSGKMTEMVKNLQKHFNTLVIDTPPLLAVTDALVLSSQVDGVILVVDPKNSKRGAIRHSIEQLRRVNANILGVVLNNVKIKRSQYYYSRNYYYGKQYGKLAEEPEEVKEIEGKG